MKDAKVGQECKIKIRDISEAGYELSEENVKIKTENVPTDEKTIERKDSGFLATLVPKEIGTLEVRAVFEVLNETVESNSIKIKVKTPGRGVYWKINPRTMAYPDIGFIIEFFPDKDEETAPEIDLKYLKIPPDDPIIEQVSKKRWKVKLPDSSCGPHKIKGKCMVWGEEHEFEDEIRVFPDLKINPDPSTEEVSFFTHWQNRLKVNTDPSEASVSVDGDHDYFDPEKCQIVLSPSDTEKKRLKVTAEKNRSENQKSIEYEPMPLIECRPEKLEKPSFEECTLLINVPGGDPDEFSIKLNGNPLEGFQVKGTSSGKVMVKEISNRLKIGENRIRVESNLLDEPVEKTVLLEPPHDPIKIKCREYFRAHETVKAEVWGNSEQIPELVVEIDGEKHSSVTSGKGFIEFDLGHLPPGEHNIKAYNKSDPSIFKKEDFRVYPYFNCRVTEEFYDISRGDLPKLEIIVDKFSGLDDFLKPKESPEVYTQTLDSLFLGEKKYRLPIKKSSEISISAPEKKKFIINYGRPKSDALKTGVYEIPWNEMGIHKKEKELIFHSGIGIDAVERVFYDNLGSESIDLEIPDNPAAQERLSVDITLKSPEIRYMGECSTGKEEILNLIEDQGPGKYELVLRSGRKIFGRAEISILDIFMFPTEVPIGGVSYVQVLAPEGVGTAQIYGIKEGRTFESPYLTAHTVIPSGKGNERITVELEDEKLEKESRELYLKVKDEDNPEFCIEKIIDNLDQGENEETGTSLLVVSPLSKLYLLPIRQWVDEILKEDVDASVGVLYWKIPQFRDKVYNMENAILANKTRGLLPLLVEEKSGKEMVQDPRVYDCPICDSVMTPLVKKNQIIFKCENNHTTDRIHFTLESVQENPPDILFVASDFFESMCLGGNVQYEVFNLMKNSLGCPKCGRIDPKATQASKLGGIDGLESILETVRKELKEEIQDYNEFREHIREKNQLWSQYHRFYEAKDELKREKASLEEKLPVLFESVHHSAGKLTSQSQQLQELKQKKKRFRKEKKEIKNKIEEVRGLEKRKSLIRQMTEKILSILFGNGKRDGEIRKLKRKRKQLEKKMRSIENRLSSLRVEIRSSCKRIQTNRNKINHNIQQQERISRKLNSRNDIESILDRIKETEDKFVGRRVEDSAKFESDFWKKVSEKMEEGFKEKKIESFDKSFRSSLVYRSNPVKEFLNKVKKNKSDLIDSTLNLDVDRKCPVCNQEWEPIQKSPTLIFHQPDSKTLPEYLRYEELPLESLKEVLNSDIKLCRCRY